MILKQEQVFFKTKAKFNQMLMKARKAATEGHPLDKFERNTWQQYLELGQIMMQEYVDMQGSGDMGSELEYEGRTLKRLPQPHDRRYVSVFGEINIGRTVYGTREAQKHEVVPLDARLNLPESDFSYLLQEWDQAFCVKESYEESRQSVQRILGIGQSVRSLEHMNRSMAQDVEEFRVSRPEPPSEEEGSILVLTADGKGVPMRREKEQGEEVPHGRRTKGQKANKKRQACVGALYTIEPFVRTSQDVVDEVIRESCQDKRPVPQHKQLRAELTREIDGEEVRGKDRVFSWLAEQTQARNSNGAKPVVCLMDGERALWKTLKRYLSYAICILDLYHVLERLWVAAHCFCKEGSTEAESFVNQRLESILKGGIGRVIGGLKQMATKHRLTGSRKKQLFSVITYLQNNRQFMHYDEYLANGYPIGSGVVEGACRHLVKDRMEQTGMRWRVEGAQTMLELRAVYINGDWEEFQQYRIEVNCSKLYPYRDITQELWEDAA